MFGDVVTVFNRREGLWYPTVIEGVQVQRTEGAGPADYGGRRADGVTVLIPYMQQEGAAVVAGKTYLPPKCWRQADRPEAYITFDTGEQFGFFLVGTWEGQGPVRDQDWPEGFFGRMDRERDGVYAIASAARFEALPHFEIEGR